jgi:hypothetical protein
MAEIRQRALNPHITPVPVLRRHTDNQRFDLFPGRRPTRTAPRTTVILVRDEFPVPCQQGLRSYDGGHFCQQPSSQRPGSDGQTAALIVGEAKPPRAELTAKDSVFLPQILNGVLLPLIHPSGNGQEQKAERVQCLRHRLSSLTSHTSSVLHTDCFGHAFNQFRFLDNTGRPGFELWERGSELAAWMAGGVM